ncbi:MAG: thermopsin family protease [Thermoplasmata archaeon]|jgi:hypothetical protein|nr:thermopsin family protease [Thermoplasmata archaeon]
MGLADLGVDSNGSYAYNTTSFVASISLTSFTAYSPGYPGWLESPNWVAISLDTVAIGLPINGSAAAPPGGSFWTENAVRFNGTEVQFEDNLWNFSGPDSSVAPTTLRSGTPLATSPVGGTSYYQRWGPTYSVSYPLTLDLENALGIVDGHPVVFFNFSVNSPSISHTGSYDQVTFNATVGADDTPRFEVNGSGVNPYGLRDDAEVVFTGDGDGSNANLATINGTVQLDRWGSDAFEAIPSSYDYGDDSGGTSEGIATYYLGTTEYLHGGPSLLYGLWNTSASQLGPAAVSGWIRIEVALDPEYGFVLATNETAAEATSGGNFSFVPTAANGTVTTYLPPPLASEPYVFEGWADGFDAAQATVAGNGSGNVTLALLSDPAANTAPFYLDGAGQVASFGMAGGPGVSYEVGSNALTVATRSISLAPSFRQLNDYLYPTFGLVAVSDLSGGAVHFSAITENATSFRFTTYGTPENLPGITLTYSFDNVSGNTSVENLSVSGSTLTVQPYGVLTVTPAVELFGDLGVRVSNIISNATVGVVIANSSGVVASNVSASDLGTAVEFVDATDCSASNVSALGSPTLPGGTASAVDGSNLVQLTGLSVAGGGTAVEANDSQNLTADDVSVGGSTLSAGSQNIGIQGSHLTHVTLEAWSLSCPLAPSRTGGESPINLTCAHGGWIDGGSDLWVENLTSVNASGLSLGNITGLSGWNLTARGYWAEAMIFVAQCSDADFRNINATEGALAFYGLFYDHNFTFSNLSASIGGNDVADLADSSDATFTDIRVSDQSGGVEGAMDSSNLAATGVYSTTDSEAVGGTNLTNLTLSNGSAESGALDLLLLESQNVTAEDLLANNGSLAVSLSDTDEVHVSDIRSTNRSVGLSWWTGTSGTVRGLSAANDSTAAQLAGDMDTTVSDLSGVNGQPGPAYFFNNFSGIVYPDGPLQTYSDPGLVVTNLTAVNCSFAIQDVFSRGVQISDVRSWGSGTAIQLNGTQYSSIDDLFAESDAHGLVLNSGLNVTVTASTIEDSTGYGVELTDGENLTLYGNNFVANDGASALGVYDPAHVQVVVYLAQGVNFTWDGIGNYWSDWTGGNPYSVSAQFSDTAPAPAFLLSWLSFVAHGLTPGARWTVAVASHSYTGSAALVVIPAWVLPDGTLSYGVVPPTGWGVTPRSGHLVFTGTNRTVDLNFTLPEYTVEFLETGLPPGTSWTASFAGVTAGGLVSGGSALLSFTEPNGTYVASVSAVPGYFEGAIGPGSELTIDGANRTVAVPFDRFTYPLTLYETGLPVGWEWGATVNGTYQGSNASTLGWVEPNGSFPYLLSAIPGWHEDSVPYHGNFSISNRTLEVLVAWFPERYSVTFTERGLPNDTSWTVVFDGRNETLTGSSISFPVANGSYSYRVFATLPTTFSGDPPYGNVTVSGNASTLVVAFNVPTSPGSGPPSAWTPATDAVLAVVVGVGLVVGVLAVRAYRRRPPPEEPELRGEDLPLPARSPPATPP